MSTFKYRVVLMILGCTLIISACGENSAEEKHIPVTPEQDTTLNDGAETDASIEATRELTPIQVSTPAQDTFQTPPLSPVIQDCLNNIGISATLSYMKAGLAEVVVRNLSQAEVSNWQIFFNWSGSQTITHYWNSDITQTGGNVRVDCSSEYCQIPVGEAKAFGFTFNGEKDSNLDKLLVSITCGENNEAPIPLPTTTPEEENNTSIQPVTDRHNYILGTQTIAPAYQFTDESKLVETAKLIRGMGSNILKIGLYPFLYDVLSEYNYLQYQFLQIARDILDFKQAIDMDFAFIMLWL